MKYAELSKTELIQLKEKLTAKYDEYKAQGLKLDMSRGKPAPIQINISDELLNVVSKTE